MFQSFEPEAARLIEKVRLESPRSRGAAETSIGSNNIKKQIRSYMSSTSVLGFQNKAQEYVPQSHRDKSSTTLSSTPTLTPTRRASQQSEDFAYFMGHCKPFVPKSHAQGYSSTPNYYHSTPPTTAALCPKPASTAAPSEQSNMMTAYVYPQTYTPIYIPIIVQSSVPTNPYSYAPGTPSDYLTGRIKFFDETQNYGFFTLDSNGSDLFVHYDDLLKSGITKDYIQMAKAMNVKFAFRCVSYYGKYNLSYKAVDVQVLHDQPQPLTTKVATESNLPK